MNKKAIAILGAIFILIIGTLGILIFSRYSGDEPKENVDVVDDQPSDNQDSGDTINFDDQTDTGPPHEASKFVQLSNEQVISPVLFFNGQGITYFDSVGRLFQADLVQASQNLELVRKRELSIPQKAGVSKILWPSQGDYFMAEVEEFGKKTWSFFNSTLGIYADLPEQVISLDWMPNGDKIIYVWLEDGKATLNISDPDSTNWQEVSEMWERDNHIDISPDGRNVLYYRTDSLESDNAINLTTPDGQLWEALVKDGYNFGVLWSPDSKKFLYGKRDLLVGMDELWVYDLLTQTEQNLNLNTSVDKAVWDADSRTVYAAVPKNQSGASFGSLTQDSFYSVDVLTQQVTEFDPGNLNIDGKNLFIGSTADKLFFVNEQDGYLYYLNLTQ